LLVKTKNESTFIYQGVIIREINQYTKFLLVIVPTNVQELCCTALPSTDYQLVYVIDRLFDFVRYV